MNSDRSRSGLTLIPGGKSLPPEWEGPISRLGLHSRIKPVSNRVIMFVICSKVVLLGTILFYYLKK